jgi:ABC-type uncharacterized transport system auxiliary subunit
MAVALAAVSCSTPRMHYYTMEIPHMTPGPAPAIARHISVQRFRGSRVLSDDRILYREGPSEVNFYEYHRWASPPVDLATNYVTHRLKDSGTYMRISSYNEGAGSDYMLRGQLHHFEEVDRGKEASTAVALELELFDTKTGAPVWREEAECTRPLATRDVPGVVRGVQECLEETASKLLGSMQRRIEKVGGQAGPQ